MGREMLVIVTQGDGEIECILLLHLEIFFSALECKKGTFCWI